MHFINVGQGDCTFIAANGVTMLVDCGEDEVSGYVVSYLRKLGVGRLDHVIATHPHSDHMGGMYRIIDVFDVGDVIIPHIPDEQMPDCGTCARRQSLVERKNGNRQWRGYKVQSQ